MLRTCMFIMLGVLVLESATVESLADSADSAMVPALSPAEAQYQTQQNIYRAITANKLSDDAQKITVVNLNGSVVLRGFVKNSRERIAVGMLAHQCGCQSVVNELKIRSSGKNKPTKHSKPLMIYNKHIQ